MTTSRNGTESVDLRKSQPTSTAISKQLKPRSEELRVWICMQLMELSLNYIGVTLSDLQMDKFSKTLCETTQAKLSRAFQQAPIEYPRFFPNAGQLLELANRDRDEGAVQQWQGFTREEIEQRERDFQSGENAEWWAQMKAVANKARMQKRSEVAEIYREPIREMTDAERQARLDLLRQQTQIAMQRYDTKEAQ